MTTIYLTAHDQLLLLRGETTVAAGDRNTVRLRVTADRAWQGYTLTAAFWREGEREKVLDLPLAADGSCLVPAAMLTVPCTLCIGIWGRTDDPDTDAEGQFKTSTPVRFPIREGTPIAAGVTLTDVSAATATPDRVLAGATFFAGHEELQRGAVPTYEEGQPSYMTPYEETDPTVPAWAKTPLKPVYTAAEVGALPAQDAAQVAVHVPITDVATEMHIPGDTAPYMLLKELGGATYRADGNGGESGSPTLRAAAVSAILSRDEDGNVQAALTLPEAIRAIPDWGEGISETVCNRLCYEEKRWIYRRRVTRVTFDGTENWKLRASPTDPTRNYVSLNMGSYGLVTNGAILCSHFDQYGLSFAADTVGIHVLNSNGYNAAMITVRPWKGITDVSEWTAYLAAEAAAGTPVTAVYALSEEEVTDVTHLMPVENILRAIPNGNLYFHTEFDLAVPFYVDVFKNSNATLGADVFIGNLLGKAKWAEQDAEGKTLASREWVMALLDARLSEGGAQT